MAYKEHHLCRRPSPIISAEKKVHNTNTKGSKKENATTFSGLDDFFVAEGTREERREYTRMLGRLFIIEFVAFGWAEILDLEIFIARCVVAWVLAGRFV